MPADSPERAAVSPTPCSSEADGGREGSDELTMGDRLRQVREAADVSLPELSTGSGLSISQLSTIERGGATRTATVEHVTRALAEMVDHLDGEALADELLGLAADGDLSDPDTREAELGQARHMDRWRDRADPDEARFRRELRLLADRIQTLQGSDLGRLLDVAAALREMGRELEHRRRELTDVIERLAAERDREDADRE